MSSSADANKGAAPAGRMEPLATLPVFFKLDGKRAVLAGGTAPAVWKAELLAAAGAVVEVYAPEPCDDLVSLAMRPPGGAIRLVRRAWLPGDLAGASIAVGAIEDEAEADAFRGAARGHGVPVNVIDKPPFCDFQFGTIVSRSPLVIGISTDGAAPVFGQALRARIEALLPQGLRAWALAARDWRPAVQALGLDFRRRRRFWETFADLALSAAERPPGPGDLDRCRAAVSGAGAGEQPGEIVLVGAGPGDPDGITLRAVRALQSADVVLFNPILPPALVGLARREATKLALPAKHDGETIESAIRAEVRPGRRLVWLDSGDPNRCEIWIGHARRLRKDHPGTALVAGLGRCEACPPTCPAWSPA